MPKMFHSRGFGRFSGGLCLALAVLAPVSACSPSSSAKQGSPESLLEAGEGEWKLVEEKRTPSPEQRHMQSRRQVNPNKSSAGYTEDVRLSHAGEDVHFRVLRLERQMNTLRSDFDKILPPLAEGARAGKSLEVAIAEIQTAAGDTGASDKVLAEAAAAPVPVESKDDGSAETVSRKLPETEQSQEVAAASGKQVFVPAGAIQVTSLRTGEHPGRTRLVLDVSGPLKFSADMDAAENILVVELPPVAWSAPERKVFTSHPLLKGYNVQTSSEGTRLVIEMRKSAKLAMKTALPPNDSYGHRIVLDIAPI